MDRATALLQGLRDQLQHWFDPIKRATGATSVTYVHRENGEFAVRIEWKMKNGELKNFEREFTRQELFGASYTNSPMSWRIQRRACDYARDTMRQVLAARGVL